MGGKSGSNDPQVTTVEPPSFQLPFLEQLFAGAGQQFEQGNLAQVAGFSPQQSKGQQGLLDFAGGPGQQIADTTTQAFLNLMQNALNPEQNAALPGFIQAAIRPVEESLLERVLPNIRSGATATGNIGSSRQGIAEGQAIRGFSDTAGDITSRILNNAFNQGMSALTKGFALAPTVLGVGQAPANIQEAVGTVRQQQTQARLDQPFTELARFKSLITGGVIGGTTTGPGARDPSRLQSAAGGAMAGAAIGGTTGGVWGAAIGAIIGLMA